MKWSRLTRFPGDQWQVSIIDGSNMTKLEANQAVLRWITDAIDGRVAVRGWTDVLPLAAHELASRAAVAGAAGVIYTDVRRDGTGRARGTP